MEKLAIIGSGTMGHSIALAGAWAGVDVKMYGVNNTDLERGWLGINAKLLVLTENELISPDESEKIKTRIATTTSIEEAAQNSSFIIETIPEDIGLKKELFSYLDTICGPEVVLASNTSGLSPTTIASETANPGRILVTHFWNPAHLIPLVEVVRGEKTSDETIVRAMNLFKLMNKHPIEVKKEIPGFVGNRLQFALFREAQYLLEEGIASKEDIDAAITQGIGRRLPVTGPLLSADMGGLDIFAAISNYLFKDLCNATDSLPALKNLVESKNYGDKSGKGYYTWDTSFSEMINRKRERELIRFLKDND